MFKVNTDDMSIYVTRGDALFFGVRCKDKDGKDYTFVIGDLLRIRVFKKKNCTDVVIDKEFPVTSQGLVQQIYLSGKETKIKDVISKPVDYWYEVELNPYTDPQTIIGYDEDGAKLFRLFPEGADKEGESGSQSSVPPEQLVELTGYIDAIHGKSAYEIAVIHGFEGTEEEWLAALAGDLAAEATAQAIESAEVATEAAERAEAHTAGQIEKWLDEHPEATTTVQDGSIEENKIHPDFLPYLKNGYVTPQMFGAVGDGVADDTQAFQNMFDYVEQQYESSNAHSEGLYWCLTQKVLIPRGKYWVRNATINTGNIEIVGDNSVIFSDANAFNIYGGWKIKIKNLVFVGCVEAIHIEGENQEMGKVIIEDCEFMSCTSHGVNITYKQSYLGTISNCRFHKCMYPIEQHASDHFIVKDCWIDERPREKHYDSSIITEGENFIMSGCLLVPRPSNYRECCWIEGNSNITVRDTRIGGESGSKPIIRATSIEKIYSVVDCPATWNAETPCVVLVSGGFKGIVIRNVKSFYDNAVPIRISETVTDATSLYNGISYIYIDGVEGNRPLDTVSNRWGLIPPELLTCFKGDKRYVDFTPCLKAERYQDDALSVHITSSGGGYYGQQNGNINDLGFSLICRVSTINEYFWKTVIINFYPYQYGEQLQYTFDVQGDVPKEAFAFEFLGSGGTQPILTPLSMKLSVSSEYKMLDATKINPLILNRDRQLYQ